MKKKVLFLISLAAVIMLMSSFSRHYVQKNKLAKTNNMKVQVFGFKIEKSALDKFRGSVIEKILIQSITKFPNSADELISIQPEVYVVIGGKSKQITFLIDTAPKTVDLSVMVGSQSITYADVQSALYGAAPQDYNHLLSLQFTPYDKTSNFQFEASSVFQTGTNGSVLRTNPSPPHLLNLLQ